ncbi:MAG: (4Fe-4S)-binding protein [Urechidicola sp.]|nr:(4Fe-4S)-binding protein [Urechidicola sp.]
MKENKREIVKRYSTNDITVLWKSGKCIHAAECVKRLPKVYKPREKPWIIIENATSEELRSQIKACPSGALSYIENSVNT